MLHLMSPDPNQRAKWPRIVIVLGRFALFFYGQGVPFKGTGSLEWNTFGIILIRIDGFLPKLVNTLLKAYFGL